MIARARIRAALYGLRTGRDYADGYLHGQTDALTSATNMIAERRNAHTDYTAAQAAVENFPLGRIRPTGQPILSLAGSPR